MDQKTEFFDKPFKNRNLIDFMGIMSLEFFSDILFMPFFLIQIPFLYPIYIYYLILKSEKAQIHESKKTRLLVFGSLIISLQDLISLAGFLLV